APSPKRECRPFFGGVPEWPKGSDCKSDGSAFAGSNPAPSTKTVSGRAGRRSCRYTGKQVVPAGVSRGATKAVKESRCGSARKSKAPGRNVCAKAVARQGWQGFAGIVQW